MGDALFDGESEGGGGGGESSIEADPAITSPAITAPRPVRFSSLSPIEEGLDLRGEGFDLFVDPAAALFDEPDMPRKVRDPGFFGVALPAPSAAIGSSKLDVSISGAKGAGSALKRDASGST